MAFAGMMSGADCGPVNPLNQMLKHTDADRSLQQDRFAGPSSSRLQHLPTSSEAAAQIREVDAALAQQFFTGEPSPRLANFPTFRPTALPQLHGSSHQLTQHINSGPNVDLAHSWTVAAQAHVSTPPQSARPWSSEYAKFEASSTNVPSTLSQQHSAIAPPTLARPFSMNAGLGMMNQSMFSSPPIQTSDKGKGKSIDFAAAFDDLTASLASSQIGSTSGIVEIGDEATASSSGAIKPDDLDSFAQYEAEFQQWMDAQREDGEYDYGVGLQQAWEGGLGHLSDREFDDEGIPNLGIYQFEKDNAFLTGLEATSSKSYLDAAKSLLSGGGSLTEAALLLEAAIQRGDTGQGGFEAWLLLGECRSMDEREDQAMQALSEGNRIAEEGGTPGAGLLTLAISYTNESYDRGANAVLLRWLRARYPDHPVSAETLESTRRTAWSSGSLITEAFMSLARSQHERGVVDADVQAALGVLFYGKNEYERAAECFQAALSLRPEDHRMWNRYGSCLTNGNRPEDALMAYREALRLRPAYTRAIYNVAVACMNVGAHKEAVEHLLDALASQGGQTGTADSRSEQCWSTLGRVFTMMERQDLADLAQTKPDLDVFRSAGFDFRRAATLSAT